VEGFDPRTSFGRDVAERYDDEPRGDEQAAVAFLAGLAGDGRALELAIGTGRIGLPLTRAGVAVDGIDQSQAMVDQLRTKPGGEAIDVTIGDFAEVPVAGSYRLVYIVYNTIYNLLTQDAQMRCFANVAAHLDEHGRFVVEALVPDPMMRLRDGQYVDAEAVLVDEVRLDVARFDPVTQLLDETHVQLTAGGIRLDPIVTRYIWPSEMDLMARLAGLRRHDRFGGWEREPFTRDSRLHVSVYGR